MACLIHATVDAFASVAVETSLFSVQWMQEYESLGLMVGAGAVALVLIAVARGRLGYQRAPSSSDTIPMKL